MKRLWAALKIILPFGLAAYAMYKTFDTEEKRAEIWAATEGMRLGYLGLSIIFAWFSHLIRARRWQYLLEPLGFKTDLWLRYHAVMIGYLVNMAIPRAGEASRAGITARYEGLPFDKTFGTIAAERIVDLLILLLITGFTVLSQSDIIWDEMVGLYTSSGGGGMTKYYIIISVVVLAWLIFRLLGQKIQNAITEFLRGIWDGLLSITRSPDKGKFLIDTVLIWLLYLMMFIIPFQCLDGTASMGLGAIMSAFIFGSFAVVLTPGGTGTYHWAIGLALGYYGLEQSTGQALGLVIWASQALMFIILGTVSFLAISRREEPVAELLNSEAAQ